jgi:hypothetical protein
LGGGDHVFSQHFLTLAYAAAEAAYVQLFDDLKERLKNLPLSA